MRKKPAVFLISAFFAISFYGCATTQKDEKLEAQILQLKAEVAALQAQVNSRAEELGNLKTALNETAQQKEALSLELAKRNILGDTGFRPGIEQVKAALRNAGYNPGVMDSKMQKETVEAIKAFQKENGLVADGMVGKKTWSVLKEYLYDERVK